MGKFILTFIGSLSICLAPTATQAAEKTTRATDLKMEEVWQASTKNFHSPKTNLFYTRPVKSVPSPAEMKELKPLKKNGMTNWHGGGSGTEDCSMLGGIILAGLCDQYKVAKDPKIAARASDMLKGLILAATAHGDKGFIARGVSPEDAKTIYPGSSRDQYTHSIHGMWRYYNSPTASDSEKKQIRAIFSDVADKMTREVRADILPKYSFKFYKGMDDDRGVAKMRETRPHEAARLAMFYAAAWDATKKREYFDKYRGLLPEALKGSADFVNMSEKELRRWVPAYAVLQMEASLEVLYAVEKDKNLKAKIGKIMDDIAAFVETSPVFNLEKRNVRDCSEVINGQLLSPNYRLTPAHEKILRRCVANVKERDSGGSYSLLAAYWRARLEGLKE